MQSSNMGTRNFSIILCNSREESYFFKNCTQHFGFISTLNSQNTLVGQFDYSTNFYIAYIMLYRLIVQWAYM